MAKVKLFGIYSLEVNKDELIIEADTIEAILLKLSSIEPNLTIKRLKGSLIFVNDKNISELNMFKTKVKPDDNISILSPIAGG